MKHVFTFLLALAFAGVLLSPGQAQPEPAKNQLLILPPPPLTNQSTQKNAAQKEPVGVNASMATTIRYVKANAGGTGTSWNDASGDLQAMINASSSGDQVWIAGGTYKPSTTGLTNARTAAFSLKNGVSVLGGFTGMSGTEGINNATTRTAIPSSTTLSGDIGTASDNSDNSYHVVSNLNNGLNNSAVLDGVVITNGNANAGPSSQDGFGGGMHNSSSSPSVVNCQFVANYATVGGGLDNDFNTAQVVNCSFVGNSALQGGGYNGGTSTGLLVNCYFYQNSASIAGGGAAFSGTNSSNSLVNCTFRGNTSPRGGAIVTESNITLNNCITWNNGGQNSIYIITGGYLASYCLFETGETTYTDGGNNQTLTSSPFANATGPQLLPCAPAVDAGSDAANTMTTDVLGNNRKVRTIDIGAAEFGGTPYTVSVTAQATPNPVCVGTPVSLQANASGTLNGPYNYTWTAPSEATLSSTSQNPTSATATSAGTLTFNLRVADAVGCQATTTVSLTVNELPTPAITNLAAAYCQTPTPVTLTGSPTGGVFTIDGLTATIFNPAKLQVGQHSVVYSYTNSSGCSATASQTVTINALPTPSITGLSSAYCQDAAAVTLAGTGNPSGGAFTIDGLSATIFNPAKLPVGQHTVVYSYTNANGCSNTASQMVMVKEVPAAPSIVTQSGHSYPAGVSSLTASQSTGNVILMVSGCAGGTISWNGGNATTLAVSTASTGVFTYTATCTNNGCTSPLATATVTVVAPTLKVFSRDPDNGQLNSNTIKPYLLLQNVGTTPIPYSTITVRYYLTTENNIPLIFQKNYVQIGQNNVQIQYVPLATPLQGATGYIEYSFSGAAGNLAAGGNSGPIETQINKQNYSAFNQLDDYSYVNNGAFTLNPRITAYQNGVIFYGMEPGTIMGSPRQGITEAQLQVRVLGNPVSNQTAQIEISGAEGQAVQLELTDLQGRAVHQQRIPQAGVLERVNIPMGNTPGMLLLQVSSPTQRQQIKLLKH